MNEKLKFESRYLRVGGILLGTSVSKDENNYTKYIVNKNSIYFTGITFCSSGSTLKFGSNLKASAGPYSGFQGGEGQMQAQ